MGNTKEEIDDGVTYILTGFHDRACTDCCMSGHHRHRQAVNSSGRGNPSWAILYSACTSQNPEQAKQKSDLLHGTQEGGAGESPLDFLHHI